MLTQTDFEQLDLLLTKRFKIELDPIKKDISELKQDVSSLRKDISHLKKKANKTEKDLAVVIRLFDDDIIDSKERIERLEIHTRIPTSL